MTSADRQKRSVRHPGSRRWCAKPRKTLRSWDLTPEQAVARFYELIADHCQLCSEVRAAYLTRRHWHALQRIRKKRCSMYASVDEMMAEFYDADPTHLSPVPTRPPTVG